jgi:hypothetical protein
MKKAIDFIGIGCAKCGTTSVFNALAMHPLIIPPRRGLTGSKTDRNLIGKECFFWDRNIRSYGIDTYHKAHWGELKDNLVYGEFSPDYILFEETLKKIRDYNPRIKLLAIFRNPVERLWSEHKMFLEYGRYDISFRELIDNYTDLQEPRMRRRTKTETWPIYRSCYGRQVKKVLELFDRENLFFIKIEELQNFSATMEKLFDFLGLNPLPIPELKLNTRTGSDEPIPFYEELMDRFFLKEIELLEDLMGWNCDDWKNYPTASGQNKR